MTIMADEKQEGKSASKEVSIKSENPEQQHSSEQAKTSAESSTKADTPLKAEVKDEEEDDEDFSGNENEEALAATLSKESKGQNNGNKKEEEDEGSKRLSRLSELLAASQMSALTAQASQIAMATQLLNLPGYNHAYLAAAAAAGGKPLANMLSMAVLQQQQQQQQQQNSQTGSAALAAAGNSLPKRGRGSRGGGLGRPRGTTMANKFKRMDSLGGRGSLRGSRGGRRRFNAGENSNYHSDYLYYMNESGSRSGAFLGSGSPSSDGGSPSSSAAALGASSLLDFASGPYDAAYDQEEMLFTEQYPGKLCALCNLSEKSALGQGEMIKYKVSSDVDIEKLVNSKKPESSETSENGNSTGVEKSPKAGSLGSNTSFLNARRRGRKLTSGDNFEHVDELDNVGFFEEPDHSYLFESSGHFYAHYQCSVWSHGVVRKKENSSEESNAPHSKPTGGDLGGMESVIVSAMWQRCQYCKHFGASIKCKASGQFYHFPCAAASGSYMQKNIHLFIGKDSLDKVARLVDNKVMYLYHDGTAWKYGQVTELPVDKFDSLLFCTVCGQHYFYTGAHVRITPIIRAGWQCQKCKWCQNCRQSNHEDRYLLCDVCDGAFHAHCLRPQMASVPKNGWKCKRCRKCTDCGSRTPGAGQSSRWHANYSVCDSCYQQRNKGLACPVCGRAYRHSAQKEMTQCSVCRKHVHSQCDPDACEASIMERRATQPTYMYVCKICKGHPKPSSASLSSSPGRFNEDSNDTWDSNDFGSPTSASGDLADSTSSRMGLGKGKPMFGGVSTGKRGRGRGGSFSGGNSGFRPRTGSSPMEAGGNNGTSWKGLNKPGVMTVKRRIGEFKRRGRQPKIRGMVGLSGPQADPGMPNDPEDESKMICVSSACDFVLKQDICVMCGSLGNDLEGRLIVCTQCGQCYHPHCVNVKLTKVILQKGWRCLECIVCEGCGQKHDEANLILCDECDISYHIYCMDPPLDQVPAGTWKCKWCAICYMCGSNDPGFNSLWFDSYSLCGPCHSLMQCNVCEESYEENELIIQCSTCQRWCHGECDSIQTEEDAEKCASEGYSCQLCRPNDILPPHLAQPSNSVGGIKKLNSPNDGPDSPDYMGVMSGFSAANFVVDSVVLTERGMCMLKAQTVEKEKARRRKRGLNMDSERSIFDTIESVVSGGGTSSADNSMEIDPDALDDDDEMMPPPTPNAQHKDGDIVRPLPDGRAPEAPEGFTVVTKDNGVMILRKRRYRDLKKVGIGGFQAKSRNMNKKSKDDDNGTPGEDKPKKRPAWRPKKNKILAQYPEYIQDSFFGRAIMDSCTSVSSYDALMKPLSEGPQNSETPLELGKEAREALAEIRKAREEEERKNNESSEISAEAATTKESKLSSSNEGTDVKEEGEAGDAKMEEDDLLPGDLLPSDIFGEDIFKSLMDGEGADDLGEIDDSALEEAEKEDEDNKNNDEALADALANELGPDFQLDSKDMADIFNMMGDDAGSEERKSSETSDGNKTKNEIKNDQQLQTSSSAEISSIKEEPSFTSSSSASPSVNASQSNATGTPAVRLSQAPQQTPIASVSQAMQTGNAPNFPSEMNQRLQNSNQHVNVSQGMPTMPQPSVQPPVSIVGPRVSHPLPQPNVSQSFIQAPGSSLNEHQQQQQQMMQNPQQQMHQQQEIQRQQALQRQQHLMQEQRPPPNVLIQQQHRLPHPGAQGMPPSVIVRGPLPPQHVMQHQQQHILQQNQGPFPQNQNQQQHIPQQHQGAFPQNQNQQQPQQPQPQPTLQTSPKMQLSSAPSPYHQPEYSNSPQIPSPVFSSDSQSSWTGGQPGQVSTPGSENPPVHPQAHTPGSASTPPVGASGGQSTAKKNQSMKFELDETLGENATIAMILYANKNHPNLKADYPAWSDRLKQIVKIWKTLPNDSRQPYVQQARENRTANRMNKQQNKRTVNRGGASSSNNLQTASAPVASPATQGTENFQVPGHNPKSPSTGPTPQELQWKQMQQIRQQQAHEQNKQLQEQQAKVAENVPGAQPSQMRPPAQVLQMGMRPIISSQPNQFRHPLPPGVRPGMRFQQQMVRPGQQTMDPRMAMMMQNRPQGMHPQQQQQQRVMENQQLQQQQSRQTPTGDGSSLLAQHLGVGNQKEQLLRQQNQHQQGQTSGHQSKDSEFSSLEGQGDLNDLGVPDEDLLAMGDNFNILEFADALDGSEEGGGDKFLDDLHAEESNQSGNTNTQTTSSGQTSVPTSSITAPPPYISSAPSTSTSNTAPSSRGPPPPYPGAPQAKQTQKQTPNSSIKSSSPALGLISVSEPQSTSLSILSELQLQPGNMPSSLLPLALVNGVLYAATDIVTLSCSESMSKASPNTSFNSKKSENVSSQQNLSVTCTSNSNPSSRRPLLVQEQPLLLEDLVEQEKREQQQQQPSTNALPANQLAQPDSKPPQQLFEYESKPSSQQQMQPQQHIQHQPQQHPQQGYHQGMGPSGMMRQQGPMGNNMGHGMIRIPGPQGPGVPAQGLLPNNPNFPPRMGGQHMQQQQQWQPHPRHPQEITLQQRGTIVGQPQGPSGQMGPAGIPQGQHPAFVRQEIPTQPPPPPPNLTPPPPPPDNPQTEEDRQKVIRYEQWLTQQEQAIGTQLQFYEKEITKLRKQKKSLSSKQRTMRKNGGELSESDAAELERVNAHCSQIQKTLEKYRKQSKQHGMIVSDHRNKKEKAIQQQQQQKQQQQQQSPVQTQAQQGINMGQQIQQQMQHPEMVHMQRAPNPGGPQIGATSPEMAMHHQNNHMGPRMNQAGHMMQQQHNPRMFHAQQMPVQQQQRMNMNQHQMAMQHQQRMQMMRMQQHSGSQGQQHSMGPRQTIVNRMQNPMPSGGGQSGMSPRLPNQPSPHAMATQPSPQHQNFGGTSPQPVRPPNLTSPMQMPVSSPLPTSSPHMSPMNHPSQSPQPSMSPSSSHFGQQGMHPNQQNSSGYPSSAQSPHGFQPSPRMQSGHMDENPFSPNSMQRQIPATSQNMVGSPNHPPPHMSPQGPQRHGSPQSTHGMNQSMRPPMGNEQMRARFVHPSGVGPGKDMRPRMMHQGGNQIGSPGHRHPSSYVTNQMMQPGQRQQMIIRQNHPGSSPQYAGNSPSHSQFNAMSPQMAQRRPPSGSGNVQSPVGERPKTPQTPRTPGGPPTPSQMSQPPTPSSVSEGEHFQHQQNQMMMHQIHNQHHQQGGGGGGNPNVAPFLSMEPTVERGGWGSVIGLKGGQKAIRGGWGKCIGLKGGSPIYNQEQPHVNDGTRSQSINPSSSESLSNMKQTSVNNSSGQSFISSSLPPSTIVTVVSGQHQNSRGPNLSESSSLTTVSTSQMKSSENLHSADMLVASSNVSNASVVLPQNVADLPPSSAHQSNIGIPGGFTPKEALDIPRLLGAQSSAAQSARYPNPHATNSNISSLQSTASVTSTVPPMPPVTNVTKCEVDPMSAASDVISAANISAAVTSIKSNPVPNCPPKAVAITGADHNKGHLLTSSITSGQTVALTSVLTGAGPRISLPPEMTSGSILSQALTSDSMTPTNTSESTTSVSSESAQNVSNIEPQHALLKQLLSTSANSPQTTTSEANSVANISLEAQLDKPPADSKFLQYGKRESLSSLASKIPQPGVAVTAISGSENSKAVLSSTSQSKKEVNTDQVQASHESKVPEDDTPQSGSSIQTTTCNAGQQSFPSLPTVPVPQAKLAQDENKDGSDQKNVSQQPFQASASNTTQFPAKSSAILGPNSGTHAQVSETYSSASGGTMMSQVQMTQDQVRPRFQYIQAQVPRPNAPHFRMNQPHGMMLHQQQRQMTPPNSQLQGLLQQQTLVPQDQLHQEGNSGQFPPQSTQGNSYPGQGHPKQPMTSQARPVNPHTMMQQQHQESPGAQMPPRSAAPNHVLIGARPVHPQHQNPQMRAQLQQQIHLQRMRMQQQMHPNAHHPEQQQMRPQYPQGPMGANAAHSRMPMRMPIMTSNQMHPVPQTSQHAGLAQGPHSHQQRIVAPPQVSNALRLSIPPQQAMLPPQPGTPTSQQASPALTPRSESNDGDFGDSSSSRGHTPGPGDPFEGSGNDFFHNGEPPQKMVKRRPSQQKRRQSQGGKDGSQAKKRPRKGSKVDENDYDACLETILHQLKNYPPVHTVEPKLGHYFNACPIYGAGEVPKSGCESDLMLGLLEEDDQSYKLPDEGDYYSVLPLGDDPPVPLIHRVNNNTRGFYRQEFEQHIDPKVSSPMSPDVFYSSSPEPEPIIEEKEGMQVPWQDLEPDDSDEDMPIVKQEPKENNQKSNLAKKIERPRSPLEEIVFQPIRVKPNPRQLISMKDLKDIDREREVKKLETEISRAKAKSIFHPRTNGSLTTSITMTLGGNGAARNVLKAINGIAKLLKIEAPKHWILEDKNGTAKDILRSKMDNGKRDAEPIDLMNVLTKGSRLCRNCEVVLQGSMVKKKATDLPFLSKIEKEECEDIYFCNQTCYFQFSMSRTGGKGAGDVHNLDELIELQAHHKEEKAKAEKIKREKSDSKDESEDVKTPHKGRTYKNWTLALSQQKRYKKMNENELTQMMFQMGLTMMPPRDSEDARVCLFCHMRGDAAADGPARLLNYDVNKWVHLNCALWSEDVYETVSGALVNVETALKAGMTMYCKVCEKNGATVKCFKHRCTNVYHVGCANKDRATFYKNKTVFCHQHTPKGEKDQELTTLAVYRRVYIERDENRQVAKVMAQGTDQNILRIGSLIFLSVGQLLPHQLHTFHTQDYIYPIGYKVIRYYWSMTEVNKRCAYVCSIGEVDNKPEFRITVNENTSEKKSFTDSTAKGVWMQVISAVEKLRKKEDLVKVFPDYICGEQLFGLTEPNIVKVLESLPGIESLSDYTFKYGRNPLLELPLAVNPTGCARSEPKLRTHVKRVHNFQRTTTGSASGAGTSRNGSFNRAAKENVPTLIGLETTGPYSKNFVQSKSSQYRKMKTEWRQNVVLARSRIQGLGLYAARDLEKHQMVIEYIGEIIRSDLTDIREKKYEDQNRGIYMFRLDDDRVLDATMCGGMARYINHSCDPNCVTECVEVDRDLHIIIFANRRIQRGEELSYDYKFDFEDENRIPCNCGAENCRKWMN